MKTSLRYLILTLLLCCGITASYAQISGVITVPSLLYPTLDSAFRALNIQGVGTSGATINFTTATNETAPIGGYVLGSATLNASLSASSPLVINGNGNLLTGYVGTSTSADAIFSIQGADFVTINALNLQDPTSNTSSLTKMEWGYVLCKLSNSTPYDGCQHDVINNCTITLDGTYANTVGIYAKHTLSGTTSTLSNFNVTTASSNSYNRFTSNTIGGVTRGVYLVGIPTLAGYDKANEVGGATVASGNTILLGGAANTCYAVNTIYDSVISVRYNNFSIAATQGNAAVYFYLPSTGVGDLTFSHNSMDITCALPTANIYCYYNNQAHKDNGSALSMLLSTHTISDNTITGTISVSTSGSLFGLYENYGYAMNSFIERNNFSNINMGNSTGYFYGIYHNYGYCPNIQVNSNKIYNFSKLGTSGYFYGMYVNASPSQTGICSVSDNVIRKIKSNYSSYSYYIYGSSATPLSGYPSPKLISMHNVLDSVDLSSASTGHSYNYLGFYSADSSLVSHDSITNIQLSNVGTSYMYNYFGGGFSTTKDYISKGNYIGNVLGGGRLSISNYLGYNTSLCDSNTIENITLNGANSSVTTYLGYYANGNVTNNHFQNWILTGGASANFTIGTYGSPIISHNLFKNIDISGLGSYNSTNMGSNSTLFEFDHNRWDSISVDSGLFSPASFSASVAKCSIHDNVMANLGFGVACNPNFFSLYGNYGSYDFYNNVLSNIAFPSEYNNSNSIALNLTGNATFNVYNNTIKIDSTAPTGSNFGFTGLAFSNSTLLDLRNNIININLKPGSGGYVVALRRVNGTSGLAPSNFLQSSNANIYFAPNVSNSWLYAEGSIAGGLTNTFNLSNDPNFNTPCGSFKSFMGHDKSSFTEDNLVAAALPGTYAPTGTSFAKNGAVVTSNPQNLYDLANVARPSIFDIGALQFVGTAIDSAGPVISFTPLVKQSYCITCLTAIIATITDATGVDTSFGKKPRLYFKKSTDSNTYAGNTSANNGWKYVEPVSIVGNTYTFIGDCSILRSAITYGDSISYFIIAQDLSTNPHVSATTASFTSCPTSVSLSSSNTPVLNSPTPDGYKISPTPNFDLSAFPAAVCQSGSTTLSVQPKPIGATVQWQSATPTSPFSAITGATADTFYTGIITTSKLYRAVIYCGTSVLDTSSIDTFIVAHPTLGAVKGDTLCGYGNATLVAKSIGSSFSKWYAAALGGSSLYAGDTFITPNISSTTTYFVTASTPNAATYSLGLSPSSSSTTMYNYGLEFVFHNASTNFYTTTVYPQGSGTITIELIDLNTGSPAKDIFGNPIPARTFNVSGIGGVSSPNILNLNWKNIASGDYSLNIQTGSYSPALYLNYDYKYPSQPYPISTPTKCVDIIGPTYNSAPYPYPYYYWFFYDNVVSCDCDSSGRVPVTAVVTPAPPISVSNPAYPGICLGQTIILSVSSSNTSYAYTWTPGPITSSSLAVSPTVSTTYHVTAKDVSTGCTAIDSAIINVNTVPAAPTISPNHPKICAGLVIGLKGSSAVALNWLNVSKLFKDSMLTTALSTTDTNSKVFAAPDSTTIYTAISNAQGCLSLPSAPDTVFVNPLPNATFVVVGSDTICAGGHSTFCVAASPLHVNAYQWYLNGIPISLGTSNCYIITAPGHYKALVMDATTGCSNISSDAVITVLPAPTISISSANPSSFCKGGTDTLLAAGTGIVSYQWAKNGTNISGAITSKYVATTTGSYTCIATNASGCTTISNGISVDAAAPNVTVTPQGSLNVCSGGSVTLQALSGIGLSFIWYSSGSPISGQTFSSYTATTSGNYYVKIIDTYTGCSDTSKHYNIVVGAPPATSITAASSLSFCTGDSVVLHANSAPGLTYQWKNAGANISIGGNDSNYTAKAAGSYTVVVTIAATPACKDSTATATVVTVNALPTASITATGIATICGGDSVVLNTTIASGIGYQWNLNNTATSPADTGLHFIARSNGNYTLTATNKTTGCAAKSNSISVTVNPAPPIAILSGGSIHFCQGDSVTLQSNLNAFFQLAWNKN
ncbi:MAG: hypothetical protein ABI169_10430, partial [Chitinophagaceae bacterium]